MSYTTIRPPFTLRFHEMSKQELRSYATWFHNIALERISELLKAVNCTPGYEHWRADFTPESLDLIGRWFEGQVETRKDTPAEVEELRSELKFPIEVPEGQLTDRTISLAMDIGIYFAEAVLE